MSLPADFFASIKPVQGDTSEQILLTLTNPVAGKKILFVRLFQTSGETTVSPVRASYSVHRTIDVPSAGSVLEVVRGDESIAPTAEVRLLPTATLGPGRAWSGLSSVPLYVDGELLLVPGDSLALVVGPTDADWTHYASVWWREA